MVLKKRLKVEDLPELREKLHVLSTEWRVIFDCMDAFYLNKRKQSFKHQSQEDFPTNYDWPLYDFNWSKYPTEKKAYFDILEEIEDRIKPIRREVNIIEQEVYKNE